MWDSRQRRKRRERNVDAFVFDVREAAGIPDEAAESEEAQKTQKKIDSFIADLSKEDQEILGLLVKGFPAGELADLAAKGKFNKAAAQWLTAHFPDNPITARAMGLRVFRMREKLAALLELTLKRQKKNHAKQDDERSK